MLYEFQTKTIYNILEALKKHETIALLGKKDSGKSITVRELKNYLASTYPLYFIGEASKEYKDFGCIPLDILDNINTMHVKRNLFNSFMKDVAATVTNFCNISVENTLDTILTYTEKSQISNMISYIIFLAQNQNVCLIFDNIEYYDQKSMAFLYNIVDQNLKKKTFNIKIIIVLDQDENSEQTVLNEGLLGMLHKIELMLPTDSDLSNFLDAVDYQLGREVPIKYLIELKKDVKNLNEYYLKKLNLISQHNLNIKRLLYTLVLLDENVFFSDLTMILSDISMEQLYQDIEILEQNMFVESHKCEEDIFYIVPNTIKTAIKKEIPLCLLINKFEIYAQQIEQYAPLDYIIKYMLYRKSGNMNNAYANAILAYCAIARKELNCTNREFNSIDTFLKNSPYNDLYCTLYKAYSLLNNNEYDKCFAFVNAYLKDNCFVNNETIFFSVYVPEYIFEIIYLRGICIGRIPNCQENLIHNQRKLLSSLLDIMCILSKNDEFILRIREQRLLLKTYISIQTRKEQKDIYNEYFSICSQYQLYIRKSTLRTREKWEIHYAAFLSKANIVSDIPDKLHILKMGFNIILKNKELYPEKYLKTACNLAGDCMWRDKIDYSYHICKDAVDFIQKQKWLPYWGVIYQMYIFSRLYGGTNETPNELYMEYSDTIWNCNSIKCKMHEEAICNSNYSILLASVGKLQDACDILQSTLSTLNKNGNKYNIYLLSTNLGMIKYLLGDAAEAIKLESYCQSLITSKLVPIFSFAFIKKRSNILLNVYTEKKYISNVLEILCEKQTLSTGYCSDNYFRPLLFSDINYWAD